MSENPFNLVIWGSFLLQERTFSPIFVIGYNILYLAAIMEIGKIIVLLFLFVVFLFVVGGVLYLIRNNDSERKFFDPRWKHYHKGND